MALSPEDLDFLTSILEIVSKSNLVGNQSKIAITRLNLKILRQASIAYQLNEIVN